MDIYSAGPAWWQYALIWTYQIRSVVSSDAQCVALESAVVVGLLYCVNYSTYSSSSHASVRLVSLLFLRCNFLSNTLYVLV